MAKKDINLGTQPTGAGGDTSRSANVKINANFTELYKAMGATLNGADGAVLPTTGLPVLNGGTGATTADKARENLGVGGLDDANTWSKRQYMTGGMVGGGRLVLTQSEPASNYMIEEKNIAAYYTHPITGSPQVIGKYRIIFDKMDSSTQIFLKVRVMYYGSKTNLDIDLSAYWYMTTQKWLNPSAYIQGLSDDKYKFTDNNVIFGTLKDGRQYIEFGAPTHSQTHESILIQDYIGTLNPRNLQGKVKIERIPEDNLLTNVNTGDILSVTPSYDMTNKDLGITAENKVVSIGRGGTGANTSAAARANLGLGTAATAILTTSTTDSTDGRVLKVGDFGIGSLKIPAMEVNQPIPDSMGSGFYVRGADPTTGNGAGVILRNGNIFRSLFLGSPSSIGNSKKITYIAVHDVSKPVEQQEILTYSILHSGITTTDANGFIKSASPIVELYADHINLNDDAKRQPITFEKLGIGDYLIKGSSGFAQSGWYVEQPKDANGNVYHAVIYDTLENGDISVKTYEQKLDGVRIVADLDKPVDVKEGRFISIRLHEDPEPEPEPEPEFEPSTPDPEIVDNEGNPAPSHLHELDHGMWVISEENAAVLEQERLAAMPNLTRRQFRLVLVLNGYDLANIETLINSIEDPMQRQITMIEWQDATTFHRTNPSLITMAGLMGLDAETVDQLWTQALTL